MPALTGCTVSPGIETTIDSPDRTKIILDYILETLENDERPYVTVTILDKDLLGLLDSGASRTILGQKGWELFKDIGYKLEKNVIRCKVANGQFANSIGTLTVPITLYNQTRLIEIVVVTEIPHGLILGIDFWKKMGILPNIRDGTWHFLDNSMEISLDSILTVNDDKKGLNSSQSIELNQILDKFFHDNGKNAIGCTDLIKHKIVTSATPIKQRYYPVNPVMQAHIDKELNEMLEQGIVERSNSPWSSPIVMVKKKDNSYRFCVDFRKLNAVTEKDAYAIPYVSHTLDKLSKAKYFSTIDIKSAFWQIKLDEDSKKYTAFTVPNRGLFHFNRLPFGLHNSSATFQRLIDSIIGPDLEPFAFAYLDDVVISTPTFEKHIEILKEVANRLNNAGLTINKEKSHFCCSKIKYLGYVVDSQGLHVDPDKIDAILKLPIPKNVREVRRILGTISWYRKYVPHFADLVSPLTDLLKKNKPFIWSEKCQASFIKIKEALVQSPVLNGPDYNLPFVLQTDASGVGIAGVLTQPDADGQDKVICYISRALTTQERKYSTTERECLAVIWCIEKLRPYLEGITFEVITDHASLVWLQTLKTLNGRLARWSIRLQQYSFNIKHRKGKYMIVPDMLSRAVENVDAFDIQENDSDLDINSQNNKTDKWYNKMFNLVKDTPEKFPTWTIINNNLYKHVNCKTPNLSLKQSQWKQVVPKQLRSQILKENHDNSTAGHPGIFKTYQRIRQKFYWPKMKADIGRYINKCNICIQHKAEQIKPAGLLLPNSISEQPWRKVSIDIVGPLPRSNQGHKYILVILDTFSKFPLVFPLRSATTKQICKIFLNNVILFFGAPEVLELDNGVQFTSREFKNLCNDFNIKLSYNPVYHPQANPVERVNRVLKTMLASYVYENQRIWDENLGQVACAIRTNVHETTNYTPYFLNFGREIVLSGKEFSNKDRLDNLYNNVNNSNKINNQVSKLLSLQKIFPEIKERMIKAHERQKKHYDLRRRPYSFEVGQQVFRRNFALSDASKFFSAKLAPKFLGPFTIKKKISPWTYELTDDKNKNLGTWHAKDLKLNPSNN